MENYMRVQQTNTKSILSEEKGPKNFLGSIQGSSPHQCQEIQGEAAMESTAHVPLKDISVNISVLKKPVGTYSHQEDKQLAASYICMLCQHGFSSQNALAEHFSSCIVHLEFARGSSRSEYTTDCTEPKGLGKTESKETFGCKLCSAKFAVKCMCERHEAKCEYQHKQGKKDQKSKPSMKPELPIFYYCNICFVGFDEERAWESHLTKCEFRPKQGKKDQNALTNSFTKEPSKDVLHEKVIEDESWLVTSLPHGYECVDAMFVVEAEGTCMLQQQIPVEPEEEQPEVLEEQEEQDALVPDRGTSPLEQDLLPPWPLSLLPGALEAEEEKEMMEQKMVLEPRLLQSAFVCVRGQPAEEPVEDPSAVTKVSEIEKEPCEVVEEVACH